MNAYFRILAFFAFAAFTLAACGGESPPPPASPASPSVTTPSPAGNLVLSGNLAFGDVMIGKSAPATLTMKNAGTGPITVRGIGVSSAAGRVFSTDFAGTTIPAGEARTATIRFTPVAAGACDGTLTVDGDQASGTNTVAVSGTGKAGTAITFAGLMENESTVGTYSESGVTVATDSSDWVAWTGYGAPAPAIVFWSAAGTTLAREVRVTAGGSPFSFVAVDLYSSMTPIPYVITGLRKSTAVFTIADTIPNTFGSFRTVEHPTGNDVVDTLVIRLSNPASPGGSNPMGLDNILLLK